MKNFIPFPLITRSQQITPQDFPGGTVVKNPPSNAGDTGWIPSLGTKIPHAEGQLSPCALEPARRNKKIPRAAAKILRATTKTRRSQINK